MTQEAQLGAAAAPVYERIKQDKMRASERVLQLLDVLERNIFSTQCNVKFLKHAAHIRDSNAVIEFHSELGVTPKTYIQGCRMETAVRLLLETDLRIWQIADLLGFSGLGVFSKGFYAWAGVRPQIFRKAHRMPEIEECSMPTNLRKTTPKYLANALDGRLAPPAAKQLIEHLESLYCLDQTPRLAAA